ncbi:MAG: FMN-binding protein [Clostridiales bacterium]|nr:FMN-binding protein [Clostridiales bacterium]
MSNKKQLPAFLVLTIICLIAALALAGTNAITKGPIKEHAMAAQREAFGAVMTADEYHEMTIPEGSGITALVEAKQDGKTIGYCVVAAATGYAGGSNPVAVTLGVGVDGKVTGAKVGDTNFAETAGFGARWLEDAQTEQFIGIDLKEGGSIQALSGATLTSNAVLSASNTALKAVSDILGIERTEDVLAFGAAEKKPVAQMTLTGDIHEGAARGFASDVRVQLTMDASGAITGLAIESSGETSGFGTRCMEDPTFAEQFISKTAPFAIGENVDALAGASITSGAVVAAVNAAVEAPANPDAVPFGTGSADEPTVETSADPLPPGAKTASAMGMMSDVKVTITLNEDGTIATMVVDCSDETEAIAAPCAEDAFLSQFIGKKGPFTDAQVVSGATYTSNGVINALNSLFPAEGAAAASDTLTASAMGMMSDVKVTITLNADGTIATMVVDCSDETEAIAAPCTEDAFLSQFIGKKGPFTDAQVVSGATYTSNGVINALNSLFPAEGAAATSDTLTASAMGMMSDVKVTITLNADGTIATMVVDCSDETEAIAAPCAEDAFLSQFIGKKGPFTDAQVVSGATYTSNGVINALNSLFPAEGAAASDTLTASAMGMMSNVKVTITLNADGTIATMVVDCSDETEAIAAPCAEDAFLSQFIGKKGPFTDAQVVSGATYTSNGVINALNSLFPAEGAAAASDTLTASAMGMMSDVKVTITLNEDGTIATMVVDCSDETEAIAAPCAEDAFLSQFIGKKGPFTDAQVVSGATYTSNGVINALNSLFADK